MSSVKEKQLTSLIEMGNSLDTLTWDMRDAIQVLDGLDLDEAEAREFQMLLKVQALLDVANGLYPYETE